MNSNRQLILDRIQAVRLAVSTGEYGEDRWHPAYERLNALVVLVCELIPENQGEPIAFAEAAELNPFVVDPTLASILEVVDKYKYQVTFTPTRPD